MGLFEEMCDEATKLRALNRELVEALRDLLDFGFIKNAPNSSEMGAARDKARAVLVRAKEA